MVETMKKFIASIVIVSAASLLSSCAVPFNQATNAQIDALNKKQLTKAMSLTPGDSSEVLYNMQSGSLERLGANYKASNQFFSVSQAMIQAWASSWQNTTSGKISDDILGMLLNSSFSDYQPPGYEKSFLAAFYALNQLGLNDFADARVEIKQMYEIEEAIQNYNQAVYNEVRQESDKQRKSKNFDNSLYLKIKQKYNFPDINSPKVLALRNSYQNAFGHYLAGFVFQALNEPSLSRPGYVKAGQLNPTNPLIRQSIDNVDNSVTPKKGYTDLLIVENVGHAPQIQSKYFTFNVQVGKGSDGKPCNETITVYYPKLLYDKNNNSVYDYQIDSKNYTPYKMVDVDLMSARVIHDEIPSLIMSNLIAATRDIVIGKQACIKQSKGKNNTATAITVGQFLLDAALDGVDERAWVMLPSKINISRMSLKYGQHTINVNIKGVPHKLTFNLNQPYQVLTFRIFGSQVYFQPQLSMGAK